jgi:hypothetical protein
MVVVGMDVVVGGGGGWWAVDDDDTRSGWLDALTKTRGTSGSGCCSVRDGRGTFRDSGDAQVDRGISPVLRHVISTLQILIVKLTAVAKNKITGNQRLWRLSNGAERLATWHRTGWQLETCLGPDTSQWLSCCSIEIKDMI